MAETIAGNAMDAVQGRMRRATAATRVITRDQVDGSGVLIGNWHAAAVRKVTKKYVADIATAVALAATYRAIAKAFTTSGTLITVVEGDGESWTNVAPLEVDPVVYACLSPLGNAVVETAWMLLPDTVVPP